MPTPAFHRMENWMPHPAPWHRRLQQFAPREAAIRRESNLLSGTRFPERAPPLTCYAFLVVASLVHLPHEEFQADDGINDDDEEHKEGNVQQRHHGLDDGVQDHLETCATKSSIAATRPPPPRLSQCCLRYHANTTSCNLLDSSSGSQESHGLDEGNRVSRSQPMNDRARI